MNYKAIDIRLAKSISEVLCYFDFEKAATIMRAIDIAWELDGGEDRTPTAEDIRDYCYDLLWNTLERALEQSEDFYYCEGRSGLRAEYHNPKVGNPYMTLIYKPVAWGDY